MFLVIAFIQQLHTVFYTLLSLHYIQSSLIECLSHKGNHVPSVVRLCACSRTIGGNGVPIKSCTLYGSSNVFCLLLGVLSLVTVQPTVAPVAKQLLPKTLGPSNVNVAAHMQHVPHMVSDAPHCMVLYCQDFVLVVL